MHLHTLVLDVPNSTNVKCTGCPVELRLATFKEAQHIHTFGLLSTDGPMIWENNIVVVPLDYRISMEV